MNKKGFTLVELLVVLVIIGIIIGLILPSTLRAIAEANAKESASNIRAINTAIQLCYTSTRNWGNCDDVDGLVTDEYLDLAPVDPFGKDYTITDGAGGSKEVDWTVHFNVWPPQGYADHKECKTGCNSGGDSSG